MIEVVAPGKVVLLGEYAVVDGGPAVVAAIDRGVRCRVIEDDAFDIEVPGDNDDFVEAALTAVLADPALYRFDDVVPSGAEGKLGLGGSAAAVVAACLAGWDGEPDRAELFRVAYTVHHAVQGSGSGVDVAAAVYGGVLRYQAEVATPLPPVEPVVIWSGASAATGPRVQTYLAWADRAAFVEASAAIVDRFVTDPIGGLEAGRLLLEQMAEAAGLDYRTPALDRIGALARAHGGAAKPSGAGGGDCAVALFPDVPARTAFEAACAAEGLRVIPVRLAPGASRTGVRD